MALRTKKRSVSTVDTITRETLHALQGAMEDAIADGREHYEQLYAEDAGASGLPAPKDFVASWYQALFPQRDVDREAPRTEEEAARDFAVVAANQQFPFKRSVSKRR